MSFDKIGKLRELLELATGEKGLRSDEKDPEEFLVMLLEKILHIPHLIRFRFATISISL